MVDRPPSRLSMDGFAPPPPAAAHAGRVSARSSRASSTAPRNGYLDLTTGDDAELDSATSGSESDGDPPGFVGQAPPPPIAPRPVLPKRESSGSGSGSAAPTAVAPSKQPATMRSFEELEDITFSSPRSFLVMALQIAQSRGVQLLIDRDYTDKSVRYMHVVCPYRHSGPCPFILKLRLATEGGWIVAGIPPGAAAPSDEDPRGFSSFECQHPARAVPRDFRPGETVVRWLERDTIWAKGSNEAELLASPKRRATTPQTGLATNGATNGTGSASRSGKASRSTGTRAAAGANDGLKQVESAAGKAPRFPRSAHYVGPMNEDGPFPRRSANGRQSTASPTTVRASASPRTTVMATSPVQPIGGSRSLAMDTDRALAPPFQRALDLQAQIAPALGHGAAAGTSADAPVGGTAGVRTKGANPYPPLTFVPPAPTPRASTNGGAPPVASGAGFAPPPRKHRPAAVTSSPWELSLPEDAGSAGTRPGHAPYTRPFSPARAAANVAAAPAAAAATAAPSTTAGAAAVSASTPVAGGGGGVSAPCVAAAQPDAVREWATFLHDYLCEPALVPLARVLGSAYVSVSPSEYFARPGIDDDLRAAVLDLLPVEAVGLWPKLRLIKAMRERGQEAWRAARRAGGGDDMAMRDATTGV
ncbi:hypothetical protein JCM3774_001865 [Rhodotorula dairenensis]